MDKDEKNEDILSITMELERPLEDKPLLVDEKYPTPKKKSYKDLFITIFIILGIVAIVLYKWLGNPYTPNEIAMQALISDDEIEVTISEYISFTPKNLKVERGFIFYPGAKIKPECYAPLAREISKAGYKVIIADMAFNMPIFSINAAKNIMNDFNNINKWTVGGHSLGGVVAARFACNNNKVESVVLLASYPSNYDLKYLGKKVLSIWGSSDGILNFEKAYKAKEELLPPSTVVVEIEGGNHSQFGNYGTQDGDEEAIISSEEQLKITTDSIVNFLNDLE
jgi:hypothetical protein